MNQCVCVCVWRRHPRCVLKWKLHKYPVNESAAHCDTKLITQSAPVWETVQAWTHWCCESIWNLYLTAQMHSCSYRYVKSSAHTHTHAGDISSLIHSQSECCASLVSLNKASASNQSIKPHSKCAANQRAWSVMQKYISVKRQTLVTPHYHSIAAEHTLRTVCNITARNNTSLNIKHRLRCMLMDTQKQMTVVWVIITCTLSQSDIGLKHAFLGNRTHEHGVTSQTVLFELQKWCDEKENKI